MLLPALQELELLNSVPKGLLINGQWRPASQGKTFDVEDPATGKALLSIADAGAEDGMAALDAAAAARSPGRRSPPVNAAKSCAGHSSSSSNVPRTSPC
jgi:succinate-semialdehyde dehydrogenase/glutarate-semialdehyde dehydrogenase